MGRLSPDKQEISTSRTPRKPRRFVFTDYWTVFGAVGAIVVALVAVLTPGLWRSTDQPVPDPIQTTPPAELPSGRSPDDNRASSPPPVRVGGTIKQPTKTKDVRPVYPAIAQSARVQGVVIIEAVIGPDGKVQDAQVLRSIPLLDAAALDCVRQWEYMPTLLEGVPVPVIMTVTVEFTLQ